MKQTFKRSLILLFTISLFSSSCSLRKNKIENNELPKPEIINDSKTPNDKEVSARGKVLCFERAKKEENAFLSETAYEKCLLTIDKNLEEFDEKQADLYFLEKKDNIEKKTNKVSKPKLEKKDKKVSKQKNETKKVKKKKKQTKNNKTKVLKTVKEENSCKEGTIAGGIVGAGIGLATAKGKDKLWAIPAGGAAGAIIGCKIDGG